MTFNHVCFNGFFALVVDGFEKHIKIIKFLVNSTGIRFNGAKFLTVPAFHRSFAGSFFSAFRCLFCLLAIELFNEVSEFFSCRVWMPLDPFLHRVQKIVFCKHFEGGFRNYYHISISFKKNLMDNPITFTLCKCVIVLNNLYAKKPLKIKHF